MSEPRSSGVEGGAFALGGSELPGDDLVDVVEDIAVVCSQQLGGRLTGYPAVDGNRVGVGKYTVNRHPCSTPEV